MRFLFTIFVLIIPVIIVEMKFRKNGNGKPDPKFFEMRNNICRMQEKQKFEFEQLKRTFVESNGHAKVPKEV